MIKRSGLRTDLELLVNDAILLGKPVDAVVALTHPNTKLIIYRGKMAIVRALRNTSDKWENQAIIILDLTKPYLRMAPQMA